MPNKSKPKRKVHKTVLAAGEVAAVKVPTGYSPVVAHHADEKTIEVVPVKKKKGWWATLFDGV